jgi:antirestriction protein ArdC
MIIKLSLPKEEYLTLCQFLSDFIEVRKEEKAASIVLLLILLNELLQELCSRKVKEEYIIKLPRSDAYALFLAIQIQGIADLNDAFMVITLSNIMASLDQQLK